MRWCASIRRERFQSWPIPSGNIYAGILRHMRPTRDGNLLIHQTSTNRIYEVNVKPAAQGVANSGGAGIEISQENDSSKETRPIAARLGVSASSSRP